MEKRGVDYRSFAEVTAQQGSAQARGRGDLQRGQQALSDEDRCFQERNASFRQCEQDRRLYFNQDGEFHKSIISLDLLGRAEGFFWEGW